MNNSLQQHGLKKLCVRTQRIIKLSLVSLSFICIVRPNTQRYYGADLYLIVSDVYTAHIDTKDSVYDIRF